MREYHEFYPQFFIVRVLGDGPHLPRSACKLPHLHLRPRNKPREPLSRRGAGGGPQAPMGMRMDGIHHVSFSRPPRGTCIGASLWKIIAYHFQKHHCRVKLILLSTPISQIGCEDLLTPPAAE